MDGGPFSKPVDESDDSDSELDADDSEPDADDSEPDADDSDSAEPEPASPVATGSAHARRRRQQPEGPNR
jgi:hypothetical protein